MIANATISYSGGSHNGDHQFQRYLDALRGFRNLQRVTAVAAGYLSSTQQNVTVTLVATTAVKLYLSTIDRNDPGTLINTVRCGIASATISDSGELQPQTTNARGATVKA